MPALSDGARKLAGAALAPRTVRLYSDALAALDTWLAAQGRAADDAALADYLAARHDAGAAPATLALAVAAVKAVARLAGQPSPAGPATARVLAGIRREGSGRGRGQVNGLQWSQADTAAAVAANGGGKLAGLRDAAMIALASDALLRVSELLAVRVADIQPEADGSGRLAVHRSKTDQEGEGAILYIGPPVMQRVNAWREAGGVHDGPLFRRIRRGGKVQAEAITDRAARNIIRDRAAAAGIDGRISGHSLRVGSA
ncbi:MAG: tyrosine-type recombinase/integrase, partial [Alphaproteobacteria bacterium]|nr:tyrosine-type recombinase/integrase [Alphaproteobacteria bacterium]